MPNLASRSARLSSPVKKARSSRNASRSRCVCDISISLDKCPFPEPVARARSKNRAYRKDDTTLIILMMENNAALLNTKLPCPLSKKLNSAYLLRTSFMQRLLDKSINLCKKIVMKKLFNLPKIIWLIFLCGNLVMGLFGFNTLKMFGIKDPALLEFCILIVIDIALLIIRAYYPKLWKYLTTEDVEHP